ncbi:MAG: lysophospholipid acyltransferase family protein [Bacilli bacterium]|nr:lysophospholipid acyltransferase family protein [Bacilli bacterium]
MRKYFRLFFTIGLYLLVIYPKIFVYSVFKKKISYEKRYSFAIKILKKLTKALHVKYDVRGLENIPSGNNIVFCPNHQAVLDPCILELIDKKAFIIAKMETRRYPYVGKIANMIDSLFLDREDIRKSFLTIKEASERLSNNDTNFLIFLEGTRSKNENMKMNDFKPGGLRPAFENHSTIVPVALCGYYKLLSTKIQQKQYLVEVEFLKPLTYDDYKDKTTVEVAKQIHDDIQEKVTLMMKNQ